MVSLFCFSSPFSLHNSLSLSSHLSLTVGYSSVGRGFGMEVRLGKSRSAACLSFFRRGLRHGFLSRSAGKPGYTSHGSSRLSATSMRSASTSSSRSEWSFGFYWSQVVKFRIFCLWVLLIDAFLVDLWNFGCLSWWVYVGFCLNDLWVFWTYSMVLRKNSLLILLQFMVQPTISLFWINFE